MCRALVFLFFVVTWSAAHSQVAWKLRKEEDGIRMYTASTDTSEFKLLKVELEVEATAVQVIAFLKDVERQPDWIYGVRHAQMLKVVRPDEFIYYSQVDLPWPCSDRDYVAHLHVSHPSAGLTILDSHAQPDYLPLKKGMVRVQNSIAHWEIRSLQAERQAVTYTLSFNPGGLIPAWLINMFLTKGPSCTFSKFRDSVSGLRNKQTEAAVQ